jgi:phytoene synthase
MGDFGLFLIAAGAEAFVDLIEGEAVIADDIADLGLGEEGVAFVHFIGEPFEDLLEGVTWDVEGRRYATAADLREYCLRVASSVGMLSIRVFGCEDPGAGAYAEELGVALQWTNILRDVREDLERGRVYLPAEALGRHGLRESDLGRRDAETRRRLDAVIREQVAFARGRFEAAGKALPRKDRRRLLAGRIMAAVYRVLLDKIDRAGAAVLDRKPRIGAPRRGLIALRLLLRDRLGGGD